MTGTAPGRGARRGAGLFKAFALAHRSLVLDEVGIGCRSGESLTYIGDGESLPWLVQLHGGSCDDPRRTPLWNVRTAIDRARDRGAVYLELDRLLVSAAPPGGVVALTWVRQAVPLGPDRIKTRAFEGSYGRRVRREGFRMRRARDDAAVREFYERHYLPYTRDRFGGATHLRTLGEVRRAVRRGFLLQVLDGERWVSGVACRSGRGWVRALAYGLRGDVEAELHRGALSAANYLLIRWAEESGLRCVDLLRSRAHVGDGVFEHKRRLGARAEVDPWPHTRLVLYPPRTGAWPTTCDGHLTVRGGELERSGRWAEADPVRGVPDSREGPAG